MINHTFIIYSFAGTVLGWGLITLIFKIKKMNDPREKSRFMLLALTLPSLIFLVNTYIWRKSCTALIWTGIDNGAWYHTICSFGYWLGEKLVPFFTVAFFYAVFKMAANIFYSKWLKAHYGQIAQKDFPEIVTLCKDLSRDLAVITPYLLIIPINKPKAYTFGFIKPTIVISQGMLKLLSREELKMVLAHELAHIVRKDVISNWITIFLKDLMFFNPLFYLCFVKYQCQKEQAADAWASEKLKNPVGYASLLLKIWKACRNFTPQKRFRENLNPYPNFGGKANIIEHRINTVLNCKLGQERKKGNLLMILSICVLLALSLTLIC